MAERGSAADNIFRQLSRYLGIAYILCVVFFFGAIVHAVDVAPIWWVVLSVLAIHGSAVGAVAASFRRGDVTWVRRFGQALAVGYGLTIATWPLVWNGDLIDANYGMWFTQFNGLVAATAALVWRVRWSLPYLVYVVVSVQFVNDAVRTPEYSIEVLTDIAWSFCLCATSYAIAVAALRSGRVLDATRAQSTQAAADAAAARARAGERSWFDALTHDRVMSTLLMAARSPMSNELAAQATGTLAKLHGLEVTGDLEQAVVDVDTAIDELRGSVNAIDDTVRVHTALTDVGPVSYPVAVLGAVCDATTEAVRNSVQHAGSEAIRSVEVVAGRDRLSVHVVDDGAGFNLRTVSPDRLGISASIRGRMETLAGGSAEVTSSLGNGTSIRLTWSRP